MSNIIIRKEGENKFEVVVNKDGETRHNVKLDNDYWEKLTGKEIPKKELIRKSFEFLLARESNQSILSRFDLNAIGEYFPGYEKEIKSSFD